MPDASVHTTSNLRIRSLEPLVPPSRLCALLALDGAALETVVAGRRAVEAVLDGRDPRLIAVVGPCAINDPHLDDSFDVGTGLRLGRSLLIEIARMGLPTATEFLEPITPQYIADTIVLGAIGARTTESPTHRQMASGLSMPVGFKNSTDGSLQAAIDAMLAAKTPHSFLGIDNDGGTCVVSTTGNPWGVLMLRGGRSGSNYSPEVMEEARKLMEKAGLPPRIIVDCSHANSGKDPTRQSIVWRDVLEQRRAGDRSIVGMMLESNIHPGSQAMQSDRTKLAYGVSVTDACIGWEETERLLLEAHDRLA